MAERYFQGLSQEQATLWHGDPLHGADRESLLRDRLSGKIEELLVPFIINKSEHICIIDPPGYANVGDSAILLGELNFLKTRFPSAKVSFYDWRGYSPRADRFIEDATIILLHGGGNFGDIWPHHQDLRMRILVKFPHKPIVQLPQSIHFSDEASLRATAAQIKVQTGFTLFVRDLKSLELARRSFECETILAPDMAFAMPAIKRKSPNLECLCLLRSDKEGVSDHQIVTNVLRAAGKTFEVRDWVAESRALPAILDKNLNRLTRRYPDLMAPLRLNVMRLRAYYAAQRVLYGVELLSRGSVVVTDRLHAHILCCLMEIPHFVFDSLGGKISAFHATWTQESPSTRFIHSSEDFSSQWDEVFFGRIEL